VLSLLPSDAEVVALSRNPRSDEGGVRWLACDLTKPGAAADVVTSVRPDVVIHLAGVVRGDRTLEAVVPTMQANLAASVELLEAVSRMGCERIVLSGSLLEEPATGDVPPSPYGASRWAASAYGRMFHALFDAPVVILRPSFAYGPSQERTKLVPYVITRLLEGKDPQLSSGVRRLDCVYAEDVARAYVQATMAVGVAGQTIDIGRGTMTSVREIVQLIAELVGPSAGRPVYGVLPVRALEQEVEVDADRTARVLDWRATTSLEDGLEATVAWFRQRPPP
jgi:nucleoside-diphosphate-sugar epimerase